MKFMSCACLLGLLCSLALVSPVSALPITSDEPSSELVVQCGIPSEFSVTASVSHTASRRDAAPLDDSDGESRPEASPMATPEPSTVGLIGLGMAMIAAFRLKKRTSARRYASERRSAL